MEERLRFRVKTHDRTETVRLPACLPAESISSTDHNAERRKNAGSTAGSIQSSRVIEINLLLYKYTGTLLGGVAVATRYQLYRQFVLTSNI